MTIVYRRELQIVLPLTHERYRDGEHVRGISKAFQEHTVGDFVEVSLLNAEPTDCVVVKIRGLISHSCLASTLGILTVGGPCFTPWRPAAIR